MPVGPRTPKPWASSSSSIASNSSTTSSNFESGQIVPSMLKTDSVATRILASGDLARTVASRDFSFVRSLCGKTRMVAPDSLAASMRQAWQSLSSRTKSFLPTAAGMMPRAVAKPELKVRAASDCLAAASADSSCRCGARVPQTRRDAADPLPNFLMPSMNDSVIAGCEASPR